MLRRNVQMTILKKFQSQRSDYVITDDVIQHLQSELKTAYEATRPKIDKSVRNDLKDI